MDKISERLSLPHRGRIVEEAPKHGVLFLPRRRVENHVLAQEHQFCSHIRRAEHLFRPNRSLGRDEKGRRTMTIWKFAVPVTDEQFILMPKDARILSVHVQREDICIWALVSPAAEKVQRAIAIRGTSHNCTELDGASFIGTVLLAGGNLVFHVFDRGEQ
jgi:hypothetical protein